MLTRHHTSYQGLRCISGHDAPDGMHRNQHATRAGKQDIKEHNTEKLRAVAYALIDIASVYRSDGRFGEALGHYENAASMAEQAGDRYAHTEAICGIAEAHLGSGRVAVALENYERAARVAGEIESLYLKGKALDGMAEITLRTRGKAAARIYWREAYDIFAQIDVPEAATVKLRLHALDASDS